MTFTDVDILVAALTVHGEARGCTHKGRVAVAYSLVNRAKAANWWGKGVAPYADHSLAAVCLKPFQYSCWNANDPNYRLLATLQAEYRKAIQDKTCRNALYAVLAAIDEREPDPTGGATHYLTKRLHMSPGAPAWAKRDDYIEIGFHRFFKGVK